MTGPATPTQANKRRSSLRRRLNHALQRLLPPGNRPPLLPFRYQLLGHLVAGILLALLLNLLLPSPGLEIADKAQPFATQPGMLAVTLAFFAEEPPQILDVQPLAEGRVSVAQPGDYSLSLLDGRGQTLYSLSFPVTFNIPGIGPIEENRLIFVVPFSQDVAQLSVTAPQGQAGHQFTE